MSTYNRLEYPYATCVVSEKYTPCRVAFNDGHLLPEGYIDQYGASTSTNHHPAKSVATMPLHLPFLPCISTAQAPCNVNKPSSWPQEYPMSAVSPFFSPDETGTWSPFVSLSSEMTPDLLFSSPSISDGCPNVFDIQFGRSLHQKQEQREEQSQESQPPPCFPEQFSSPQLRSPPTINKSNIKASPSSQDNASTRRRHPCLIPGCQRRFTSQYTLKVHMQAHKPKPRVSFVCTLGCGERFSRQHDRLRHEVAKHNKVCEFSCEACGRFFSMAKTLGNHKCPVAQGGTRWVNN
ncbi:hypothetical protein DFS33DRAFT_1091131 [Desarmillaria ectypa]|nr:hypothetical protein DFS33DRAFT_1091131 [Desarmillaria ectypa]